jgi:hypothetical protein
MRNQRNDGTIRIFGRDTENQAGANLCSQAQINKPDFPAWWRPQDCASRRSSSKNTASAARRI